MTGDRSEHRAAARGRREESRADTGRGKEGDDQTGPERREVAGDEAGENVEAGAALGRGVDDFANVTRRRRGEDLGELGDERTGDRAAADDDREDPPEIGERGAGELDVVKERPAGDEGDRDRDDRGDPDQPGERRLFVEVAEAAVPA